MGDLPSGWEERLSTSRGLPYFYNRLTGTTQWERPTHQASQEKLPLGGDRAHVYHLLVKHCNSRRPSSWREPAITRTPAEALEIIQDYESQIRASADPLAKLKELAGRYSDCGSAREAGDLGTFGRGKMQPSFEEASFALSPGELSSAVTSESGIHLIYRVE